MLKIVLSVLLVALIVFAVVVSRQPSEFKVSRSAVIPVPAASVFPHVNNLHNWHDWSPWAKLDPNSQTIFSGPDQGGGAAMHWIGNKDVGEGKMTIIESRENEYVRFRMDFVKPFKATNNAEFTFASQGNKTQVTWKMSGRNNFVGKAVSLFMDCDKMVGDQFESGLQNLASVSQN